MRYTLAIAVAMLGMSSPAFADAWDFILTNSTSKVITLVELSPTGANQWQKNAVDPQEKAKNIIAGARTTIHFDRAAAQCKWDLKATFADATSAIWSNINLCDASFVTLKYANNSPTAVAN